MLNMMKRFNINTNINSKMQVFEYIMTSAQLTNM